MTLKVKSIVCIIRVSRKLRYIKRKIHQNSWEGIGMIEIVRGLIRDCNQIVILSGLKVMQEAGLHGVLQEERAYDIELKYGYSPDEIVTSEFLNRRVDKFYKYYKHEILNMDKTNPTKTHYAVAELEKRGKLLTVVTRTIYGLYQMAGVRNIIELHGSANENSCPKCGKIFSAEYIAQSKGTPICDTCKVILKPGFALLRETVDNGKVSKVAENVSKADVLIIAGARVDSDLAKYSLQYYKGDKLVLINDKEDSTDKRADYILYGRCEDIFPQIIY